MRRPPSAYAKAASGGFLAAAAAFGAALADGRITAGEWLIMLGAFITGALGVGATRNTQTVETGPGDTVTVGDVVSSAGTKVGEVIVDTGLATGGIVADTTGLLGQVLDATVGKLLPSGRRRGS
jgi:hypothetical protein